MLVTKLWLDWVGRMLNGGGGEPEVLLGAVHPTVAADLRTHLAFTPLSRPTQHTPPSPTPTPLPFSSRLGLRRPLLQLPHSPALPFNGVLLVPILPIATLAHLSC